MQEGGYYPFFKVHLILDLGFWIWEKSNHKVYPVRNKRRNLFLCNPKQEKL